MSEGVIYIATGNDLLAEAKRSVQILRRSHPDVSVTLFSDATDCPTGFDDHVRIRDPRYGFGDKVTYMAESPYEKTVFLDSDIYVNDSFHELFSLLDQFDMAAVPDAHQQPVLYDPNFDSSAPDLYTDHREHFLEFNTGVVAYRDSDAMNECFEAWKRLYDPDSQWSDQPSFRTAVYESDVRFCTLSHRYNFIPGLRNRVSGTVKIFHNRLLGPGWTDYKDLPTIEELEAAIDRINRNPNRTRVTYPISTEVTDHRDIVIRPPTPRVAKIAHNVSSRGLLSVLIEAAKHRLKR